MVTVTSGTNIRLTGRFDDDNVIGQTDGQHDIKYKALHQCRGDFYEEGGQSNVWWVLIDLGGGHGGWVHAVRILQGGDDQPIPDVHQQDVDERSVARWF